MQVQASLQATNARILSIQWHPQFEHILAAGSFDNTVRVHDVRENSVKEMEFHTDRVRSLNWSSEVPWLLVSGGDDSRQVCWDVRSRMMIFCAEEPTLAMTSFTSHYDRPFIYFSSHFDASIIQWNLLGVPDVALPQIKFLLNCERADILQDDLNEIMTSNVPTKLTGTRSR